VSPATSMSETQPLAPGVSGSGMSLRAASATPLPTSIINTTEADSSTDLFIPTTFPRK
jgi:hypothetical protein